MIGAILGLIIGVGIGLYIPLTIAAGYSLYLSVAILAAFDSVVGAIRANIENQFDSAIFLSGFILNSIIAATLAYMGDLLGIPLYYAAIFAFGMRLFTNLARIRRDIIFSFRKED
ncbi:MAG: small basic family protein [Clostridiales bacterium]|nr:small basic family protein [Clostridiales bacterium]